MPENDINITTSAYIQEAFNSQAKIYGKSQKGMIQSKKQLNMERDSIINNFYIDEENLRQALKNGTPNDNGIIYSHFYNLVLSELVNDGTINTYTQTKQNQHDDKKGIDFWITTIDNKPIPISITGNGANRRKRLKQHMDIPQISVRRGNRMETRTVRELKEITMKDVENYIKSILPYIKRTQPRF